MHARNYTISDVHFHKLIVMFLIHTVILLVMFATIEHVPNTSKLNIVLAIQRKTNISIRKLYANMSILTNLKIFLLNIASI